MCLCGKGLGENTEGNGGNGVWGERWKWTSQGWGGLGSILPTTFTAFYHWQTVFICSTMGKLICQKKRGHVSAVKSGCSCWEHLQMPVSIFPCPTVLRNRLLLGSLLQSFIIGQPGQKFLGNNEVIFRNYLMIRKATKRSETGTFSFMKSSRSECVQICNETVKQGKRKN